MKSNVKERMKQGELVHGIWMATGSSVVAEIAGKSGFDWMLIDMEHGLGGEQSTLVTLQALGNSTTTPIVRVPSFNSDLIKRVLDFGAAGIMAPMINNAEAASSFIRSIKYPPLGTRGLTGSSRAAGYGYDFKDYFNSINDTLLGIVQIETLEAVENIDAIAAVEGVDVVFIGHSDLSLNLGCFRDFEHPDFVAAEQKVLQACKQNNKTAGMLLKATMDKEYYQSKGYGFIALGTDIGCLKNSFAGLLK